MTHLNHVRKYYLADDFSITLSSYIHLSGCLTNDHVCILRWLVEALRARFRWNRDQSPELISSWSRSSSSSSPCTGIFWQSLDTLQLYQAHNLTQFRVLNCWTLSYTLGCTASLLADVHQAWTQNRHKRIRICDAL